MIREELGIQCMPCFSQIINEMLTEMHTMEKVLLSQIYNSFSNTVDSRYLETKGTSKKLRDIRTSTYQMCSSEEKINNLNNQNYKDYVI